MQNIKIGKTKWMGLLKQKRYGCRAGCKKVPDDVLKELLVPFTNETSQPHKRFGVWRRFQGSKMHVFKSSPLKRTMCYESFRKATYRGRLGIGKACSRVDDCDYCDQYDHKDAHSISEIVSTLKRKCIDVCPTLFQSWDLHVAKQHEWQEPEFRWTHSPTYVKQFMDWLMHWQAPADSELTIAQLKDLELLARTFAVKFMEPEGWYANACGISAHLALEVNQKAKFRQMMANPQAGHLYVHTDMQELTPLSPIFR